MITVALVQVGDYEGRGVEYVAALRAGLRRHLRVPHQVHLLTDEAASLFPGTYCRPADPSLRGWWQKLRLFKPGMFPDGDRVLYLDLDTTVVGSLDAIAAYAGDFAVLRDFYRPDGYGSGVMAWRAGASATARIWDSWCAADRPRLCGGDQAWIESAAPGADRLQDLFPGQLVSFKADGCAAGVPEGARLVCFHGRPKPHELGAPWWPEEAAAA